MGVKASSSTPHTVGVSQQIASPPFSGDSGGQRGVPDIHAIGVLTGVRERPAASVRLYTLGTFDLLLDLGQGRVKDLACAHIWGHGRAQELLLLLLLRRRPLRRQEAAATLWPDADPTRRARLLRNALWNLRGALAQCATLEEAHVVDDGHGGGERLTALTLHETPFALSLDPVSSSASGLDKVKAYPALQWESADPFWCDLHAFETIAAHAHEGSSVDERIALGRAALRLYGGPFLAHRQGRGSGSTSESAWVLDQRTRSQAQWISLSLALATDLKRVGERVQALDLLMQILEQDPLQLEAARRAMLLLSGLNRVDEALVVYEQFRHHHRDVFQKEPSGLKEIAMQVRAGRSVARRDW